MIAVRPRCITLQLIGFIKLVRRIKAPFLSDALYNLPRSTTHTQLHSRGCI
ncbi:hypothetical protein F3B23_13380 [Bacteroides fragilis]|uniref:Uncharacterized protein n=1 Tax=Bacteroides fragilis TaxID=817 RepID=A0A5M5PT16_BACFG|nr:hypothetical protein F3B28_14070 [Bacteroides fragilis]KAA4706965.1 hypothetical protein F3B27_16085 [Bacteroides fragilis]KAA4719943.1 hypothetical protein F3B32_09745 [Bacteroides fragilis]KAA4724293.1 hypothetical protein F3B30_20280 [Bacteroides fragilis]KAA4726219.1 hypothetical protein F3B31_20695 [Bacteroides fragilis]